MKKKVKKTEKQKDLWENKLHFVSWLNLCPNNKISGGKIISSKLMRKKPGIASQAFVTGN